MSMTSPGVQMNIPNNHILWYIYMYIYNIHEHINLNRFTNVRIGGGWRGHDPDF